jgi:hypothetical protein
MLTFVTFVKALIVAAAIVYGAYSLMRLAAHCVRWMVRSIGPHAPKRVGRPHVR